MKKLDLRSKTCPETFLYAKLALEELGSGEEIEIEFGSSDDAEKVASSLELEGLPISRNIENRKIIVHGKPSA